MADRIKRDKNEKETGEPFQLDKEPRPAGRPHEERKPMEHERPQHAEPLPGGAKK
jgi:hypothetical protein